MLVVLLVLTAGVSCSDDEELLAGNGIADAAWSAENQVEIEGGVLNYTFAAASDWTARSSADWCEVQTGSGMAGESLLRLKVAKNTRAEARSATDYRQCVGDMLRPVSFVVKQGKGLIEQGDGKIPQRERMGCRVHEEPLSLESCHRECFARLQSLL